MSEPITKGQYKIITPPDTLKKKVRVLSQRDLQYDPIAKAERAVEFLSVNFADWMDEEVRRLITIWQDSKTSGFTPEMRGTLFRTAHDLRGEAATLGFPSVGLIAGVFCNIMEAMGERPIPDAFMEKYIAAIRAIARETKSGEDNTIAGALADELTKAGDEMIARLNAEDGEAA